MHMSSPSYGAPRRTTSLPQTRSPIATGISKPSSRNSRAGRVVVLLGRIAFDAFWRLMARRGVQPRPKPPFGHSLVYEVEGGPVVVASYHPSRQNTNTGKLTTGMLEGVFRQARTLVER